MQISISEEKNALVTCFMVTASTNGKDEEVFVSDVATAAEQGKIFKRAGHENFWVCEVSVLISGIFDDETGYFFGKDDIRLVTVYRKAIPAKYSRADIYPCVKVCDYDKDVLKRRVTGWQVLIAIASVTVLIVLFVGMIAKCIFLGSDAVKLLGVAGLSIMMIGVYNTVFGDWVANKLADFGLWVAGITPLR